MEDPMWGPGHIYRAWDEINRAVLAAIKPLPRPTLLFLANRASDRIVRAHAARVLDWQENRHNLPDWGWGVARSGECLRPRRAVCGISGT